MTQAAFRFLIDRKITHSKIRNIEYSEFVTQTYLNSPLFSDAETSLLYALRSRYNEKDNICQVCDEEREDQNHILLGKVLKSSEEVVEDIFRNVKKQKGVTGLFKSLIKIRRKILDPNTSGEVLKISNNLHCIDNFSSGK